MDQLTEWMVPALTLAGAGVIALWMAGAIYYDVCGGAKWGRAVAAGWLAGVVALFAFWQPLWQPFVALLGVAAVFIVWWLRQKPRHDREWEPEVAVLPRAVRDGDAITFENVRDFQYRSLERLHAALREPHLPPLESRAAWTSFSSTGVCRWMSHPVLVFDFGPDGHICISIEVRYRKGQKFSVLRSLYRQQELDFAVTDERDAILRRTKYGRPQEAHLYRMTVPLEEVRAAFLDYVAAINDLYEKPRWYHGLCTNCTTTFYWLPNSRCRCDWRVLANSRLDKALYEAGRLDEHLPFPELRRMAYLNEVANSAPVDGFGDHVRRELERRRHER